MFKAFFGSASAPILTATLIAAVVFSSSVSAAGNATVAADFGKTPLVFEPNQGQADERVKFLSRGRGYFLFLTESEAVLSLQGADDKGQTLRMKLLGAEAAPKMTGLDRLPGVSNYFIGRDRSKWRTGVPHYTRVGYEGVYPGIDLVFYGTSQRRLEYDFVVAPGADPSRIALSFEGAERLEIDAKGDLVAHLTDGEVRFLKPVIYQEESGTRRDVEGKFTLTDTNRVGFQVASYNPSKPLVIDPVLVYSTFLGGSGGDTGNDIAVDDDGNAYVTGQTQSPDFPTTDGSSLNTGVIYSQDAFVTKLNPEGTALVYSTFLGGSEYDYGTDIAIDDSGRVYVTGGTGSDDFPVTARPFSAQPVFRRCCDSVFFTVLDSGGSIAYATYGLGVEIALRPGCGGAADLCRVHLGLERGPTETIPPSTIDAFQEEPGGGAIDGFVMALDPSVDGVNIVYNLAYGTYLGGTGLDSVFGIAVDSAGLIYATGYTTSESDFPTTVGAFDRNCGDDLVDDDCFIGSSVFDMRDAFVAIIDPAGGGSNDLVYGSYLGGDGRDRGVDISLGPDCQAAADSPCIIYVVGNTDSENFPTTLGSFQRCFFECTGIFISVIDPADNGDPADDLVYSTHLGGTLSTDRAFAVAVDFDGNIFVTGEASSEDFPVTDGSTLMGPADGFVAKMTTTGELVESTLLGGFGMRLNDDGSMGGTGEWVAGIDVDPLGAAYVSGRTSADDFPTTPGAFDTDCGIDDIPDDCTEGSLREGFVAKLIDVSDNVKEQRIHVSALDLDQAASLSRGWASDITVTVHGGLPLEPIEGATVIVDWVGDGARGRNTSSTGLTCVTDSGGQCSISSGEINDKNVSATFFVTAVSADGRIYVPGANHDPGGTDPDSNGTQITVLNPSGSDGGGGGGGKPCNPNKPGCS